MERLSKHSSEVDKVKVLARRLKRVEDVVRILRDSPEQHWLSARIQELKRFIG
jgi:hypothetical protein